MKALLLTLLIISVLPDRITLAESPEDRAKAARIEKKLHRIIIPRLEFRDATLREAIDFLKKKTVELDDENPPEVYRGPLRLDTEPLKPSATPPPIPPELREKRISLSLRNISAYEALQKITGSVGAKFWIRADGLHVGLTEPEPATATPKSGTPAANEKPRK